MQVYLIASDLGGTVRGASLGGSALVLHDSVHARVLEGSVLQRIDIDPGLVYAAEDRLPQGLRARHIEEIVVLNSRVCQRIGADGSDRRLFLTGDHSTAVGIVAGLQRQYDNLGILWVDAHCDLNTPQTSPSGNLHGMSLGAVLADEALAVSALGSWTRLRALGQLVPAQNIVFLGARSIDTAEQKCMERNHMTHIGVSQARSMGMEAAASQALRALAHCSHVFVSWDIDALDDGLVPGTGTPVAGGFTQEEALALCRSLSAAPTLCAWEITEFNPMLDDAQCTLLRAYAHMCVVASAVRGAPQN